MFYLRAVLCKHTGSVKREKPKHLEEMGLLCQGKDG